MIIYSKRYKFFEKPPGLATRTENSNKVLLSICSHTCKCELYLLKKRKMFLKYPQLYTPTANKTWDHFLIIFLKMAKVELGLFVPISQSMLFE